MAKAPEEKHAAGLAPIRLEFVMRGRYAGAIIVQPAGQVGEIAVRGPNVMRGYYSQPEETAATLRDRWLHTGDMGKKDDDGYIYIVDRRKEMLLVRGMNVYPREIEEVLHQFPNVREAAVVPKPDEKRGEVPIAFVSPAASQRCW